MNNEDLIIQFGKDVKNGISTWAKQTELYNLKTGKSISSEAFRKRFSRLKNNIEEGDKTQEYTTLYGDGTVEAQKIVNLSPAQKNDQTEMLKAVGYNPDEWELQQITFSNWQQHTKEQDTKELYAVKFKIKPIIQKEINIEEALEEAKKLFSETIKPLKTTKKTIDKELNDNRLIESPPIELHLGELSNWIDTGENYDQKIANERFKEIINKIVQKKEETNAGNLLINVGGDFFNSDTLNNTTTKGTQQFNDVRWRKLFLIALKMWSEALETLKDHFNKIDIQLVSGNHDLQTSFYLYCALKEAFKNYNNIEFKEDYKEVQAFVFGQCLILTTHGSKNVNRTMDSIVSEFALEYGQTKYRELHLGHLHSEMELKERLGIIPRRVSTPKGIGNWEYDERFGHNIQKHELFIWEKDKGLIGIEMIPFEPAQEDFKKKLIRRK